jgi:hypothetical protein
METRSRYISKFIVSGADIANASITAADIDLTTLSTSNVAEGTNLYFTNNRVWANVQTLNYASISYVDSSVANLVNSAPATLNTLNELATALGNDASFATTVTNLIATKANTASLTTANVTELTNLYFSNARARASIGTANASSLIYYEANGNFQAVVTAGGGASVTVQNTAPLASTQGTFWLDSDTMDLYVSYGNAWVMVNGSSVPIDSINPLLLPGM